jgi:ATP-dependent exoDNAse (exonuclease V) alpha subunit
MAGHLNLFFGGKKSANESTAAVVETGAVTRPELESKARETLAASDFILETQTGIEPIGSLTIKPRLKLWLNTNSGEYHTTPTNEYPGILFNDKTSDPDAWPAFYAQEQEKMERELTPPEEIREDWARQDEFLRALQESGAKTDEYGEYVDGITDERLLRELGDYDASPAPVEEPVTSILEGIHFELDPSQEAAVIGLVKERHGCLIGAAGTGKTTTTKVLVHTLIHGNVEWGVPALRLTPVNIKKYHERAKEAQKKRGKKVEDDSEATIIPSIVMVAYTGQATQVLKKNMPRSWAKNVMTIHLCLGFVPVPYTKEDGTESMRFEPTYNKMNKMPWDVIVVDETSMVSVDLWHLLVDAAKPGCRFYFVGDLNQLPPPIGTGILGFALSKWPTFELTVVHRQADDSANRIVDTAHRILRGQLPEFDDDKQSGWRVAGYKLPHQSDRAHAVIVQMARQLAKLHEDYANPESPLLYDPFRDRIMVAMNGYNEDKPNYMLGQAPLNESLAQVFAQQGEERIIINAKRATKRFAVGYRVMATKNEGPGTEDRVTNGLTGRITGIRPNPKWTGDRDLVGPESEVSAHRRRVVESMESRHDYLSRVAGDSGGALQALIMSGAGGSDSKKESEDERQGGPASHIVSIQFDNGGFREYGTNATVESIQLAYASTVHKTQGAEMPMAIVVIHHNQKQMLNRELFYTAVTRASRRVLILYTDLGLQIALRTQKISGHTLEQKIRQYQELLGEGKSGFSFRTVHVRLDVEDPDEGITDVPFDEDEGEEDADAA